MTATFFATSALVTVVALIITMHRLIPFKYMLGYALFIDLAFSLGMLWVFSGTFTGVFSATLAGLMLATFLSTGRYCFGYSIVKLTRRGLVTVDYPSRVSVRFQRIVTRIQAMLNNGVQANAN